MHHSRTSSVRRWACLALLLLPWSAWADPKDDARRHFAAGLKAAQEGRYEEALDEFLAAQESFPHPASLYNIAKAYNDLGNVPEAIRYYELFQEASPEQAAQVEPVLASLRAQVAATEAPPTPVGGGSGGVTADSAQIERLRAIAAELEALSQAITAGAPSGGGTGEAPPPDGSTPDGAAPPEAVPEVSFQEEAYGRVVVTASRVGQDPLDSPSTVTVLTADDIRLSGATDLPDLLRRVVGVDVMSLSSGHSDIAIRGSQRKVNNKVLVLIDGRSTYLDFIGVTFWAAFPIELEEIERVEVIRGPGSAVYGANAVTGVINIITRTPGEGGQSVAFDAGAPGYTRASAVTSGRQGTTAWRMSAGLQTHGRWAAEADLDDPSLPVEPFLDEDDAYALDYLRANARVDQSLGDDAALSLSGGIADGTSEFYNIGALPNYGLELHHHYLRADAFAKQVHLRGFWNENHGSTGPWTAYPGERELDSDFDNDVVDVELEAPTTFTTGKVSHVLNAGGGWRYKAIKFGYLEGGFGNEIVENHFQAFVNEQATLGRLGLVGSLRVDRHPLIPINETLSPRAAILFRAAKKTSLRATAGSAYRAPTAIESYMDFALPTPVDGVYIEDHGNRDLDPERILTFELGVHDESTPIHVADAVVYVQRVTDLIGLSDVTPVIEPFDPTEIGFKIGDTGWINEPAVYTSYGFEGEAEVFPTDGLELFGNVAVRRTMETDEGETVVDTSSSELLVNAGGSVRTPWRTDVSLEGHFLSAQEWRIRAFDPDTLALVDTPSPLDARFLLSARIGVRPFVDHDLELAFVAWNPLAGSYEVREHPEGQPLGSRWIAQAAWRF